MVGEFVLVGAEAEAIAGLDVGGEVVDVEGFAGDEFVGIDGVMVDFILGFDGSDLEGIDTAFETTKDLVVLKNPRAVDGVGVGEEDQAVSVGLEFFDGAPHRLVGCENILPSVNEVLVVHFNAEDFEGPGDVFFGGNMATFEVVFTLEESVEAVVDILV